MKKSIGEKQKQIIVKRNKLRDNTFVAIRAYLKAWGWKDFDPEMLTNNMMFVIDPFTGQNFPIDHAYTIQTSRELYDLFKKHESKT